MAPLTNGDKILVKNIKNR